MFGAGKKKQRNIRKRLEETIDLSPTLSPTISTTTATITSTSIQQPQQQVIFSASELRSLASKNPLNSHSTQKIIRPPPAATSDILVSHLSSHTSAVDAGETLDGVDNFYSNSINIREVTTLDVMEMDENEAALITPIVRRGEAQMKRELKRMRATALSQQRKSVSFSGEIDVISLSTVPTTNHHSHHSSNSRTLNSDDEENDEVQSQSTEGSDPERIEFDPTLPLYQENDNEFDDSIMAGENSDSNSDSNDFEWEQNQLSRVKQNLPIGKRLDSNRRIPRERPLPTFTSAMKHLTAQSTRLRAHLSSHQNAAQILRMEIERLKGVAAISRGEMSKAVADYEVWTEFGECVDALVVWLGRCADASVEIEDFISSAPSTPSALPPIPLPPHAASTLVHLALCQSLAHLISQLSKVFHQDKDMFVGAFIASSTSPLFVHFLHYPIMTFATSLPMPYHDILALINAFVDGIERAEERVEIRTVMGRYLMMLFHQTSHPSILRELITIASSHFHSDDKVKRWLEEKKQLIP